MLSFLLALRQTRKAFQNARIVKQLRETILNDACNQAMAYAWEIGNGAPMREMIMTSPANPFLWRNWRDNVIPGNE